MKVKTLEISWHNRDPVYSVDLQPGVRSIQRLATGGVDKFIRIWSVSFGACEKVNVEILWSQDRHTKSVNIVRFSPDGEILASAGDDGVIFLWMLQESSGSQAPSLFDEDEFNKETWAVQKTLRGHVEDIYDLCWSSCGSYLVSGAMDYSAIVWDVQKETKISIWKEHKSFVQGVSFKPSSNIVATLSSDRSCRIFRLNGKTCIHNVYKLSLANCLSPVHGSQLENVKPKSCRMFHDDSMRSFFRRLSFSPDGELLVTPAGCIEDGNSVTNTTYVFSCRNFSKPVLHLPSKQKATVAVKFSPVLYKLSSTLNDPEDSSHLDSKECEKGSVIFDLPYRMIFAVATEESVILYDTQQTVPFGFISKIHFHQLSDLSWSSDGQILMVSSTDGYVSIVHFEEEELGERYQPVNVKVSATDEPITPSQHSTKNGFLQGDNPSSTQKSTGHNLQSQELSKISEENVASYDKSSDSKNRSIEERSISQLDSDTQVKTNFKCDIEDESSSIHLMLDSSSDSSDLVNTSTTTHVSDSASFGHHQPETVKNSTSRTQSIDNSVNPVENVDEISPDVEMKESPDISIIGPSSDVEMTDNSVERIQAPIRADTPKRRIQLTTLSLRKPN